MNELSKLIKKHFPIESQTSETDKLFLLKIMLMIKSTVKEFNYIEIGSYMGGSLTPFLLEDSCALAVSVDERQRQQPDERGAKYDYTGISNQTMIDKIVSHGISIAKLVTHDGPISTFDRSHNKFDLAFIDGEHTDLACVRDFIWTYPMMKANSIILFHDSTIVHKALSIIREVMAEKRVGFHLAKDRNSEISALFLGGYAQLHNEQLLGKFEDWASFQNKSEILMLSSVIANRVKFTINHTVEPMPLIK